MRYAARFLPAALSIAAVLAVAPAMAKPSISPQAEAQVVALTREVVAMRSVSGPGNRTGDVARAFKAALLAGGWAERDVEIVPVDDTAYLIATWPGSDPSLGPVVISAHMDVVEARPEDWQRDPFTPVIENGMLYGRGTSDTKFDAALALVSLAELRRQGFSPKRSIVIAYSGDEETSMKTSKLIADRLAHADLVLNVDGASGVLAEETGKPLYWSWQGAEKTYVDYRLEVTNPGGHSSAPRKDNAIAQLGSALARIAAHDFPAEVNPITRGYFEQAAALQSDPKVAAAMRAFAADPADAAAVSVLAADPYVNGKLRTTCVPTMIDGGHAQNALPQRATANVNCRIFPGHSREEIRTALEQVVADPAIRITDVSGNDTTTSPASPVRADFVGAATRAIRKAWGKVPVIPSQASGASDSMWYRAKGVASYSASPTMMRESDDFAHGLNERVPLGGVRPGLVYYTALLTELAAK